MKKTLVMLGRVGSHESLGELLGDDNGSAPAERHIAVIECDEEGLKALAPFILEEVPLEDAVYAAPWLHVALRLAEQNALKRLPELLLRVAVDPRVMQVRDLIEETIVGRLAVAANDVCELLEALAAAAKTLDSDDGRELVAAASSRVRSADEDHDDLRELVSLLRKAAKL